MKKRILALLLAMGMLITSASALTVEQARNILEEYYIDNIPEDVLAHDTVDEILEALGDPYAAYFTAEELAEFYASVEDVQIVGIGIRSYYLPEGVLVTEVAPNSPAEESGVQVGDWIIAVDGYDTRNAAEEDLDKWLHGRKGSGVMLTILRGEKIFGVYIVRREVVFPTARLEKIENGIGWIRCSSFGSNTFVQFYDIIRTYDSLVDGWVVDLRGNTGGNALTAVLAAGCFGGWNSGVYMRDGSDHYYAYQSCPELIIAMAGDAVELSDFDENGYLTDKMVCVLTDEYTASAAELFCAAVRDSGAGLIVGERTYGKGVAQTLFSDAMDHMEGLFEDGDGLKITTERCFSVAGGTYDHVGVFPHVSVPADLADEVAALLMAPYTAGSDALNLRNVCTTSSIIQHFVMPMDLVCAPENADAVEQLFARLNPGVTCQLVQEGEALEVTPEEAAEACGVTKECERFSDMEGAAYADDIETMRLYGIVEGCGDGTFRPTEQLTRAETCALLVKAMRYPVVREGTSAFKDVDEESVYTPYVNALFRLGLVIGDEDGLFRPDDNITHEEFLVLLGRVAQWMDMDYYELMRRDGIYGDMLPAAEELEQSYPEYSEWAREEVWLSDGEYAWDDPTLIDPDAATTREEAVESLYGFCRNSGLLAR